MSDIESKLSGDSNSNVCLPIKVKKESENSKKRKYVENVSFETPKKASILLSEIEERKKKRYKLSERIKRSPGFSHRSIKHQVILNNYQKNIFTTPKKKRKYLPLTPKQKAMIEKNKSRARDIREINSLILKIKSNKSAPKTDTNLSPSPENKLCRVEEDIFVNKEKELKHVQIEQSQLEFEQTNFISTQDIAISLNFNKKSN